MSNLSIGDWRAKKKVSGKFYFAYAAAPNDFINFGNVLMHKREPKLDYAQTVIADGGKTRVNHEEISKIEERWTVKLDEYSSEAIKVLHLANQNSDLTQSSGTGSSWSLSSVSPGYSYYVGSRGLTAFAMTSKTEGTDYIIDKPSGMLTILIGGTISASSSVAGTLTRPALTFQNWTAFTSLLLRGNFRIEEYNHNISTQPLVLHSGNCELKPNSWGDFDPTKFSEYEFGLLCTGDVLTQAVQIA